MVDDGSVYVRQPPRMAYQRRTIRIMKVQQMLAKNQCSTEHFLKAMISCDDFRYENLIEADEEDDDDSIFNESLEEIVSDDDEELTAADTPNSMACCICMVEPISHAFQPCGHLSIGATCVDQYIASTLDNPVCPVCRAPFTEIQRMFF